MIIKFDLQIFKGNVSSTTTYTASPEERALLAQQMQYLNEIYPNMVQLNTSAGNQLWNSYADTQADYSAMNNNAQRQIANAQAGLGQLANGVLPADYLNNASVAVNNAAQAGIGSLVNQMAQNGVLNSSMTSKGLNDISKNAANAIAENYTNGLTTLAGLYNDQITNAGQGIAVSSAAQDAAINIPKQMWQISLGLDSANSGTLSSIAGKYGTTTTTKSGGSSGLGSIVGNLAGNWLGNSGLVAKKW